MMSIKTGLSACKHKAEKVALKIIRHVNGCASFKIKKDLLIIYAINHSMGDLAFELAEQMGPSLAWVDYNDSTALMYAICNNMVALAHKIIDSGYANYEQKNKQNFTALTFAYKYDLQDIIKDLTILEESGYIGYYKHMNTEKK